MIGQPTLSVRGRDKNRVFIIVKILDDNFVEIADGRTRKISKPKRKKLKHLKLLDLPPVNVPQSDRELYRMIKELSLS